MQTSRLTTLALSLTNRSAADSFSLPSDGWIHIVPLGEYTHPDVGLQVLDAQAAQAMVARFNREAAQPNFPGLRLDYDHFSYDPEKSSEAAGWITQLDNRDDGIWAKVRWVNTGRDSVESGKYRLVSPVFSEGETLAPGRLRPVRLDSVALTNNPNLRGMVPVTNRSDASAAAGAARVTGTQQHPTHTPSMKLIANRLNLQPDASEQSIDAAVAALIQSRDQATAEVTTLKNRVASLEADNKTLLAAQVEADLAPLVAAKADETALAGLRTALLANRTIALPVLQGLIAGLAAAPAAGGTQGETLKNRTAGRPASTAVSADAPTQQQVDGFVAQIQATNRCTATEAYQIAKTQKPEWFTPRR